jgi:hypothetical protein
VARFGRGQRRNANNIGNAFLFRAASSSLGGQQHTVSVATAIIIVVILATGETGHVGKEKRSADCGCSWSPRSTGSV